MASELPVGLQAEAHSPKPQPANDWLTVLLVVVVAAFAAFVVRSYVRLDEAVYATAHCTRAEGLAHFALIAGILASALAAFSYRRRRSTGSLAALVLLTLGTLAYCKGYPGVVTYQAYKQYPGEREKCMHGFSPTPSQKAPKTSR